MTRRQLLRAATGAVLGGVALGRLLRRENAAHALAAGGSVPAGGTVMMQAGDTLTATFRYDLDRPAETFCQVTPWRVA